MNQLQLDCHCSFCRCCRCPFVRISFSQAPDEQLAEGVRRLGVVLRRRRQRQQEEQQVAAQIGSLKLGQA